MNDVLELLLYLLPLAIILTWYGRTRAKRHAHHAERLKESVESGLVEPACLHPIIDPNRCIGSGACTKVCPEKALGIIDGKARLVNPSVCIGHGACQAACPVEAISLVFGTERRGVDIPEVKPNFETNVPGIFIAGELGGMGLIRKAAEQGRQAIGSIEDLKRAGNQLDVVIVGAGPAGIAAGLGAVEHKLRYVLVEQEDSLGGAVYHYPRNKITMTAPVQLPLVGKVKFTDVQKERLIEFWEGVVQRTGLKVHFNERMERIERLGKGFRVITSRATYETRAVLLAIGRRGTPRKLGVPGEEQAKVVYKLVDAEQYRGQRVLVVGGGDSALEAAIALAEQPGTKVALSYRGEAFNRVKPKNRERLTVAEKAGRVKVMLDSQVAQIGAVDVTLRQGEETFAVPSDAVIVCAGGVLPTELLKRVGIAFETKYGTA
jgi:thioredoxin reductase/NAD-dependent dihydropyrimidine dehydrogenase PreA subunit